MYWLWNFVPGHGSLFWREYLHFWEIVSHLGLPIHLLIAQIYVFECEIHIQDIILAPKFSYKLWILILVEKFAFLGDVSTFKWCSVSFDGTDLTFRWWYLMDLCSGRHICNFGQDYTFLVYGFTFEPHNLFFGGTDLKSWWWHLQVRY